MHFALKLKEILSNRTKGRQLFKTSHEQNEFSYELTFWFISIENSGKQKSKNTLRVEINQFCDS